MNPAIDIFIVDDELKAAEVLEALILQYFDKEVASLTIFTDPLKALEAIRKKEPHLIFLDIRMPEMSGMDFVNKLEFRTAEIIFVTAYSEYAIKAIRAKAFDYLVKPVDEEDLLAAMERFKSTRSKERDLKREDAKNKTLLLRDSDKVIFQDIAQIIRAEGFSNYSKIYRENGKCVVSSKTLKEYESILEPCGFIRIHKSHLLNPHYVKSILKGGEIILRNGDCIPIAKRRKKEVKMLLHQTLGID